MEGRFEFEDIAPGSYVLRAQHFAFEETLSPYTHPQKIPVANVWIGRAVTSDEIPFGAADARRDLSDGHVYLLKFATIDLTHYYVPSACFEQVDYLFKAAIVDIERSFGYGRRDITDQYRAVGIRWRAIRAGVDQYNAEIERHLVQRNGASWRDELDRSCAIAKRDAIRRGCPDIDVRDEH